VGWSICFSYPASTELSTQQNVFEVNAVSLSSLFKTCLGRCSKPGVELRWAVRLAVNKNSCTDMMTISPSCLMINGFLITGPSAIISITCICKLLQWWSLERWHSFCKVWYCKYQPLEKWKSDYCMFVQNQSSWCCSLSQHPQSLVKISLSSYKFF
jgi:hypothetical protein